MKKMAILLTILCLVASCGKSGSATNDTDKGGSIDPKPKPADPKPVDDVNLFSKWNSGNGGFLDFTGGSFNTPFPTRILTASGTCYASFTFIGNQNSGEFAIDDQTCDLGNDAGQYTKSHTTLTLCSFDKSCITLYK